MIVSREAIRAFAELTGDDAPIHADPAFAREAGFAAPIAQGLFIASLAERTLAGRSSVDAPRHFEVRFREPVVTDDELQCTATAETGGVTGFEVRNQNGSVVARGRAAEHSLDASQPDERIPPRIADSPPGDVWYAEDVMLHFESGERALPGVTSEEAARFRGLFGAVTTGDAEIPASLLFARGFAAFLAALLDCPLPSAGSAGHLGDRWRAHRRAAFGEPLQVHFEASSLTHSRSQLGMAIVEFAIEVSTEAGPLVEGTAAIMIRARPPRGVDAA